jgi:hypothetical protein
VKGKFQEKIVNTKMSNSLEITLTDKMGEGLFLHAEVCRSNGALENIKFQAPNYKQISNSNTIYSVINNCA